MKNMSDELLIDTYFKAIELNLHPYFINLLKAEIHYRSLAHKIDDSQPLEQTAL
ncbi:sporulation histidine kinase inhibitor Sda [Sporosarcina ureilytica]|uniref:Sporulation protein n=1 Tax=Sporosarcina ureilytica TaxID=298596 RepID=A0A1D8JIM1_9BACL|nr:sporulation histidine kinase inhibitor Sda [Sporosarcina ureilytica]AOV08553.1 sporulation protein [Sporosarcina ureilytica]